MRLVPRAIGLGVAFTFDVIGGAVSILTVTDAELESGMGAELVAAQVNIAPVVGTDKVVGPQPNWEAIPDSGDPASP